MGVDKNSSPKRELGLYPKFTTKDSHMSLPKSRSHYGPTNPRNKPQTIPNRRTNQEAKDLTILRSAGRTIREPGADSPRTLGGRSATHEQMIR
jgi:hypothetical protein